MPHTHTVQQLLQTASEQLRATSPTARLDAELLLAHILGWSRARLLAERSFVPDEAQHQAFAALVERRSALEPVAYLIGHKEFFGLDFVVDRRVLIPRPETELLVELALAQVQAWGLNSPQIADVGTGSGCIAVTLAVHLPTAHIQAIDLSPDALALATHNVARHQVAARVELLQGDLLAPVRAPIHLLVSNPPYTILHEVEPGVYRYEPHLALDGGTDAGLALPRRLLEQAPAYLAIPGALLMEIGAWQGEAISILAQRLFPTAQIDIKRDLAGRDRVLSVVQAGR